MIVRILIQEGTVANMDNQEVINFDIPNPYPLTGKAKVDGYIFIDGKAYPRTPDPDRVRRLIPPDKPIVLYCNTRYFLINSAKLQMVNDLNCIIGISQTLGKQLLLTSQNKEADNE